MFLDEKTRGKANGAVESSIVIIAIIVVFYLLSQAASIAIPFLLALLLSILLSPIVKFGVDRKVPAMLMVLCVLVLLVSVLFPLGVLISSRMSGMLGVLPSYYMKLVEIGKGILAHLDVPKEFWDSIDWYNTIGGYLSGMTGLMLNWLGKFAMVLVFLVFMLLESPTVETRFRHAFAGDRGRKITMVAGSIVRQISKYLRTLFVISFVTGCFVWLALTLIGVDFALAWGVVAFLLNFIPTIGSIVASIPPVLVAIVQFYPDVVPAALAALSLLSIQFIIGNIMTPKIMGDALDLSPVVILVSLMCWGLVWGIAGALLSVPIAVMIKIICENIPHLRSVSMMMCSARDGKVWHK